MNNEEKLLLIWEMFPEETSLYLFNTEIEITELARQSNNLYIGGDILSEDHPIFTLNERLKDEEEVTTPIKDNVVEVVKCGIFL